MQHAQCARATPELDDAFPIEPRVAPDDSLTVHTGSSTVHRSFVPFTHKSNNSISGEGTLTSLPHISARVQSANTVSISMPTEKNGGATAQWSSSTMLRPSRR